MTGKETNTSAQHYLLRGEAHFAKGELRQAIDCFKIARYKDPNNARASACLDSAVRQLHADRRKPAILVVTLPKSGSVYIAKALREGLNLASPDDGPMTSSETRGRMISTGELQLTGGRFPDILINYALIEVLAMQPNGVIGLTHLPPTRYNLLMVNRYLDRLIVNLRDPRQAILSLTHYFRELEESEPLITFTYSFPENYFSLSLTEQIDYQIENWLPVFINWVEGWVNASEDPRLQLQILFTHLEDLKADPRQFFESILEFYGIDKSAFTFPEKPQKGKLHYRKGGIDEWREVFTPEQAQRASDMIPERLLGKFGWSPD